MWLPGCRCCHGDTGDNAPYITTRKYDRSGTQLWTVDFGRDTDVIAWAPNGSLYVSGVAVPVGIGIATTTAGDGSTNEIQKLYYGTSSGGVPISGTFTLSFGGDTTAAIDWDATAANIVAELEAIASVGVGNVSAIGGPLHRQPVYITFEGTLGLQDVALITIDSSGLTGGATLRKYNTNGQLQWSIAAASAADIACDNNGVWIVTNTYTSGVSVKKYDASGLHQWDADMGDLGRSIGVDSSGSAYVGHIGNTNIGGTYSVVRKLDSSGSLVWSKGFDQFWNPGGITIRPNEMFASVQGDRIFVRFGTHTEGVEPRTTPDTYFQWSARELDSSGNTLTDWLFSADGVPRSNRIGVDSNGDIWTYLYESSLRQFKKFSGTPNSVLWSKTFGSTASGFNMSSFAIDADGQSYVTFSTTSDSLSLDTLRSYDSSGTALWTASHKRDASNNSRPYNRVVSNGVAAVATGTRITR